MKRFSLMFLLAVFALTAPAHACRYFDAYDGATGDIYTIETNPPSHPSAELILSEGGVLFECSTTSIGVGVQTRSASCVSEDGSLLEAPITWVQFEDNAMLRAAVFNGYVFYPGCDL